MGVLWSSLRDAQSLDENQAMRIVLKSGRSTVAILLLLAGATLAWASGATFVISGLGISLGEGKDVDDGGKELHRLRGTATVGAPFTLTAQGMVLPRGGKAEPGEPEAGTWSFDAKRFDKLVPVAPADKTKLPLGLEAKAPGTARVRFAGKILGYDRAFEVVIDVVEKK